MELIEASKVHETIIDYRDKATDVESEIELERAYGANDVGELISQLPIIEAIPKDDYENRLKADMAAMLEMIRQDLLDKLVEERSEYHISDVGIGLERALKTVDEYIVGTNGESLKGEKS